MTQVINLKNKAQFDLTVEFAGHGKNVAKFCLKKLSETVYIETTYFDNTVNCRRIEVRPEEKRIVIQNIDVSTGKLLYTESHPKARRRLVFEDETKKQEVVVTSKDVKVSESKPLLTARRTLVFEDEGEKEEAVVNSKEEQVLDSNPLLSVRRKLVFEDEAEEQEVVVNRDEVQVSCTSSDSGISSEINGDVRDDSNVE